MNTYILAIVKFIAGYAIIFYQGFIATFLWTWFVFPIFGIATPSFGLLAGLILSSRLFLTLSLSDLPVMVGMWEDVKSINKNASWFSLEFNFIMATSAFIGGWVLHFFI